MSIRPMIDVLNEYDMDPAVRVNLHSALLAREDEMVSTMQLAGVQFGLFPQIVAEVLTEVGIGTPKSEEERALIRANFVTLMEQLQREARGE